MYCTHLTKGDNPLLLEPERERAQKGNGGKEDTTTRDKTQSKTGVRN